MGGRSRKPVEFLGTSLDDLRKFPEEAKQEAGYQIDRVQTGLEPSDWKAMTSIGSGAAEIRIKGSDGTFRVIYVAKFEEAVFVLHCFQKKTQKTSTRDIELAARRYRDVLKGLKS